MVAEVNQDILLKVIVGLEVVKNQQAEVYRRIGHLETSLNENWVDQRSLQDLERRIRELEEQDEKPSGYWPTYKEYFWGAIWTLAGTIVAAAVLKYFGVEIPIG